MTVATRPEIPLQVITPDDVRASIQRAKSSLERAAAEVIWQVERQAWRTLGYSSWGAMLKAEYGGVAVMLPSSVRPEVVAQMKAIEVGKTVRGGPKRLTDQEIGDTFGVSRSRVQDDLHGNNKKSSSGQNVGADDDVIDAEIVDDDQPIHFDRETGEVLDTPDAKTDPVPAESAAITVACPTCHGTGKVTR